jgi:hypothetical protein
MKCSASTYDLHGSRSICVTSTFVLWDPSVGRQLKPVSQVFN